MASPAHPLRCAGLWGVFPAGVVLLMSGQQQVDGEPHSLYQVHISYMAYRAHPLRCAGLWEIQETPVVPVLPTIPSPPSPLLGLLHRVPTLIHRAPTLLATRLSPLNRLSKRRIAALRVVRRGHLLQAGLVRPQRPLR